MPAFARQLTGSRALHWLLLSGACLVFLWFRLGHIGLVDPDEPFYALTAREMLASGDWLTPRIFGAPQFEKPVLFYWLTMTSFSLFGETELAARLVPALFGTLLVLVTYELGRRLFRARAAFLAAFVLATALSTVSFSRSVLTDVVFATFLTASLYAWWRAYEDPERGGRWVVLHFVACALSVLTKGPLGSLLVWMTIGTHRLVSRRPSPLRGRPLGLGLALYVLIAVPWFALMLWRFGWEYFQAFFIHENYERLIVAEHPASNHWYYYLVILSLGTLPWMPLLAIGLARVRSAWRRPPNLFLACWFVPALAFLTAAQSKLPTYVYFLFVPLALWMGDTLDRLLDEGRWRAREAWPALVVAVLQAGIFFAAPLLRPEVAGGALRVGLVATGGLLAAALLVSLPRPSWAGIGLTTAAMLALTLTLIGPGAEALEAQASVRGVTLGLPEDPGAELPVITEKLLVRGVAWYTGRPVAVASEDPQPFWTRQNVPILTSRAAVQTYLARHGGALCILRPGREEWELVSDEAQTSGDHLYFGRKGVTLLSPPGPEAELDATHSSTR